MVLDDRIYTHSPTDFSNNLLDLSLRLKEVAPTARRSSKVVVRSNTFPVSVVERKCVEGRQDGESSQQLNQGGLDLI
jgi:hypothetical protein